MSTLVADFPNLADIFHAINPAHQQTIRHTHYSLNSGDSEQNEDLDFIQNLKGKDIFTAFNEKHFTIYYQPQVTKEGQIHAAEALLRWIHPEKGIIATKDFIEHAENTGLIHPMTNWVMTNVFEQLKSWHDRNQPMCPISINISPKVIREPQFIDYVKKLLDTYQISTKYLEFEITETSFLSSEETTLKNLHELKELGISIAIDDFGTGYSSLDYLRRLQADTLKIDQVFVQNIDSSNNKEKAIISSILYLAKGLDLKIIAEGVETYDQFQYLKQQECEFMQGNYFSKAVPIEQFEKLLRKEMINPVHSMSTEVPVQRRNYFRFKFTAPVKAEMTITAVNQMEVNVGAANILIYDISIGGLKIHSSLSLPVVSNIRYQFTFKVLNESFDIEGIVRWKNESDGNTYIYGVEFIRTNQEEERLAPIINKMCALKNQQKKLPGTPFVNVQPITFFMNH